MKTLFVFIVVAMLGSAFAQAGQQPEKQDSLLQRARKGDDSALSEMEQTGDMQDLRSLVHDRQYAGRIAARLHLARMGDQEALQYYVCRSLVDDVFQIEDLMRQEVDYIGGDFNIEVNRHLLDSDSRFLPEIERIKEQAREHGGDSWPALPSIGAILRLSKLLPEAQIPGLRRLDIQAHPGIEEEFKTKWRVWIDAHQATLEKLKPTAKGISFDSSHCTEANDASQN